MCRGLAKWVNWHHETLLAKSLIDGIAALVLACSLGIGVFASRRFSADL
ncbi:DUF554 family protein [Carnobacterium sp.]